MYGIKAQDLLTLFHEADEAHKLVEDLASMIVPHTKSFIQQFLNYRHCLRTIVRHVKLQLLENSTSMSIRLQKLPMA